MDTEPGSFERSVCCAYRCKRCGSDRAGVGLGYQSVYLGTAVQVWFWHLWTRKHIRAAYLANGLPGGNISVLDIGIDLHVSRHSLAHALHQEGVIGGFYLHKHAALRQ